MTDSCGRLRWDKPAQRKDRSERYVSVAPTAATLCFYNVRESWSHHKLQQALLFAVSIDTFDHGRLSLGGELEHFYMRSQRQRTKLLPSLSQLLETGPEWKPTNKHLMVMGGKCRDVK